VTIIFEEVSAIGKLFGDAKFTYYLFRAPAPEDIKAARLELAEAPVLKLLVQQRSDERRLHIATY
jgi:hypothetical protein